MLSNRLFASLLALSCASACADAPQPVSRSQPSIPAPATVHGEGASAQPGPSKELMFTAQDGWIEETPSNAARKAQYVLPKVEDDPEDASLVVYHFPGGGGSVQDNLERWASEFVQPDGSDSMQAMERRTYYVNSMGVEEIALSGTCVAETPPGSGQRVNKPDFAVRAAIISSNDGPYYAKLIGPARTVAHWERSFRAFIAGLQP